MPADNIELEQRVKALERRLDRPGGLPDARRAPGDPTELLLPNSVTADLIATGGVGTIEIADDAVTEIDIAYPTTSAPTSTSTADPMTAVIPEMTITKDWGGDPIIILWSASVSHGTAAAIVRTELYEGSTALGGDDSSRRSLVHPTAAIAGPIAMMYAYTPTTGSKTISARWNTTAGTITATGLRRMLVIVRVKR